MVDIAGACRVPGENYNKKRVVDFYVGKEFFVGNRYFRRKSLR